MNKENARQNIIEISGVLDKLKMKWWLDAGTCLGAVRDHDFISHDNDTDIGIFGSDKAYKLTLALAQRGFRILHIFGTKRSGYEISVARDVVKTDFFFYDLDGDKMTVSLWYHGKQVFLDHSKHLFEKLKRIEFLGRMMPVPNPVEEYLTERYGDWREVVKEWSWHHSPKNLRI